MRSIIVRPNPRNKEIAALTAKLAASAYVLHSFATNYPKRDWAHVKQAYHAVKDAYEAVIFKQMELDAARPKASGPSPRPSR